MLGMLRIRHVGPQWYRPVDCAQDDTEEKRCSSLRVNLNDVCKYIAGNFPNSRSALEVTESIWTVVAIRPSAPHRTSNQMQVTKALIGE